MVTRKLILPIKTVWSIMKQNLDQKKLRIIFMIGVLNICAIGLIFLYAPFFFTPSIPPPYQTGTESTWENTTYSVQVWPPNYPLLQSKYFILRNETIIFQVKSMEFVTRKTFLTILITSLINLDGNDMIHLIIVIFICQKPSSWTVVKMAILLIEKRTIKNIMTLLRERLSV